MKQNSINITIILLILFNITLVKANNHLLVVEYPIPKEEVIIVCDRNFYLTGEDILFSAKVFIDNKFDLVLSKVIYLELFKDNISLAKVKYKLIDGRVQGNINIPEGLLSGNYYLRAYTMYMRNQAPETFFNTHLTIINPERKVDSYYGKYSQPITISTQNKNLIANIKNQGAVFFNEQFLKNVKEGFIVNNNNDSVCKVKFFENGLGSFTFTPKLENKYSLKVYLTNNDSIFVKLADVKPKGILTTFDYINSVAEISQSGYNINSQLKVYFVGSNHEVFDYKDIVIIDTTTHIKFPNLVLPESVNYMVVADKDNKILSVLPFYAHEENTNKGISIKTKKLFTKREKVEFDIMGLLPNDEVIINVRKKNPEKTNDFPAQIMYNPLILNTNYNINHPLDSAFKKQLYLSFILNKNAINYNEFSELIKSFNESPAKSIIKDQVAEIRDLSISGKIIDKATSKPLANETIYASVLGENPQLHSYDTDSAGNFIFSLNQLQGINDVGLTMDSIDNVDAEIIINNDFSTSFPKFIDYPVQADSTYTDYILALYRNKQVNYRFKKIVKNEEVPIDNIPFPFQNPQTSILLSDYIELATMQEVLNEIVTYVSARINKGKMVLNVLNDKTETQYDKPLVLIDNLVVFDIDELMKLNPATVNKIEVITKPYTLGSKDFKGIVMITTKATDFGGMQLPNETVFLKYITASPYTYYQYPDFEKQNIPNQQPYFANTIYNESRIIKDRGENNFSFYTSDESGKFEIVVSIIKQDGTISIGQKTIEVK